MFFYATVTLLTDEVDARKDKNKTNSVSVVNSGKSVLYYQTGDMTFITIFQPGCKHLRRTHTVAVTSGINCLEDVRGMMHITGNMNVNSPGSLFFFSCTHTLWENNMRNGQRATLFSVNWRVQVAKLILGAQDPTSIQRWFAAAAWNHFTNTRYSWKNWFC